MGEDLVVARPGKMSPDEAAAYFVLHREHDMTAVEQEQFLSWFSENDDRARALRGAELAWRCFDDAEESAAVAKMRTQIGAARPRQRLRIRGIAASIRRWIFDLPRRK